MELLFQLLVNGIALGAAYALIAIGLALIWSVTGVFHLAHGGVYTVAGYLIYAFSVQFRFPMVAAVPLAALGAAVLGLTIDAVVYRPLLARGARSLTLTVASLAVLIFLLNLVAATWGTETKQFGDFDVVQGFELGTAYIAGTSAAMVVIGAALFASCMVVLHRTRTGRALRAVTDNPAMSRIVGVNLPVVHAAAYAIGSALTVPAAYLIGLQNGLSPYSGMTAILMASAAVIVGGVGSVAGAGLGAVVLALAQNVGIWQFDSVWQESIAFAVLLAVIILRPTGFFGARGRTGGV
jgi:branched-chain amino acid transport system permease protein